jgi:hypothetical protein
MFTSHQRRLKNFAPPCPGTQGQYADGVQRVALQGFQYRTDLIRLKCLDFRLLDFGRPDGMGHVARDQLALEGPLKRPVQNAVGVADGARRQCAAVLTAGRQQLRMPFGDWAGRSFCNASVPR